MKALHYPALLCVVIAASSSRSSGSPCSSEGSGLSTQPEECWAREGTEDRGELMLMQLSLDLQKAATVIAHPDASASPKPEEKKATEEETKDHKKSHENGGTSHKKASEHEAAEHSELHHRAGDIDMALGASMLGMIAFIMGLFYITNSADKDIRKISNEMISNTISIFVAVLSYGCAMMWLTGWMESSFKSDRVAATVAMRFFVFMILLIAFCCFLRLVERPLNLKAFSVLGSHLVGFAAAEAFADLQEQRPFSEHVLMATFIVGFALWCFYLIHNIFVWAMRGSEALEEAAADFETDAFSFCTGFLLAQSAKMSVLGHLTPIHGQPKAHSQDQIEWLAIWGMLALAALVFCVGMYDRSLRDARAKSTQRIWSFLQMLSGMTAAWIFFFVGQWLWFFHFPSQTVSFGAMLLAFVGSVVAMVAIYVLDLAADYVAEEAIRAVIATVATAVGLSWEKAFHEATHAVGSRFDVELEEKEVVTLMTFCLAIVVLPAWRFFILPRTCAEDGGKARKGKEPAAFTTGVSSPSAAWSARRVPEQGRVLMPSTMPITRRV
jgi:hypothetical protein